LAGQKSKHHAQQLADFINADVFSGEISVQNNPKDVPDI